MELVFLFMLVATMAIALGSGFPVAFALPGAAIVTIAAAALFGFIFAGSTAAFFADGGTPEGWLSSAVTNFRGIYWDADSDTLIAIPLFIFMGVMLQRSKIAEDLLVTMARLFGRVPGGLGVSVVFVGALLAATTGIVGATVVAMGLISLPAMLRNNYSKPLATGTIAASGTLGQIIPPSIVLIILADQLSNAVEQAKTTRVAEYKSAAEASGASSTAMPSEFDIATASAGDMFLGALLPGIVLVLLYMITIIVIALIRPSMAPAVRGEGGLDAAFWRKMFLALVPPLALIFIVLGSILSGIASVNEAGAIGAAGATVMAGYRLAEGRRSAYYPAVLGLASVAAMFIVGSIFDPNIRSMNTPKDQLGVALSALAALGLIVSVVWSGLRVMKINRTLYGVMMETAKTTSLVFIILIGAAMLTAAFRAFGGEEIVRDFLQGLPGGFWTQFFIVMAVIFILGFFLDFIEIAVVVVPIVAPILLSDPSANVSAVWLGVMIGLNMQTSFLTPPFGFALFYLRGVAPKSVRTVQMYKGVVPFIGLQLLALVIVAFTPSLVNYLPTRSTLTSDTAPKPISSAIQACVIDYTETQMAARRSEVESAIARMRGLDVSMLPRSLAQDYARNLDAAVQTFTSLEQVKAAEAMRAEMSVAYGPQHAQLRTTERRIWRLEGRIARLKETGGDNDTTKRRIKAFEEEIATLKVSLPADRAEARAAYRKLIEAEQKAIDDFDKAGARAYAGMGKLLAEIRRLEALEAIGDDFRGLKAELAGLDQKAGADRLNDFFRVVSRAQGRGRLVSTLRRARSEQRKRNFRPERVAKLIDDALKLYETELTWRRAAQASLSEPIATYRALLGETVSIRHLDQRLPRDLALHVAACRADHRDLSLYF